jgi:hypothetical protein
MESNKPNVIPTKEQIEEANRAGEVAGQQHTGYAVSAAEKAAAEEMLRRTEQQLKDREEALRKQAERAAKAEIINSMPLKPEPQRVVDSPVIRSGVIETSQANAPYDLIPLPSEGLIYPSKKARIKVAFLNASDENILTSPHLLESGEFLDILLRRKIIDEDINPRDLHVGDRNAIMVWLRATAYGTNYPVEVINPYNGELIETEIDLSDIKTKKLGAIPDNNGLFDFKFPISAKTCKFKLLSVRDVEEISKQRDYEINTLKKEYADSLTFSLEKQIIEIDGNRDINYIRDFISVLRVGDSRALRKYVNEIESGLDMNIEIQVPGGEPFTTFLPINLDFFWPKL